MQHRAGFGIGNSFPPVPHHQYEFSEEHHAGDADSEAQDSVDVDSFISSVQDEESISQIREEDNEER